MKIRNLFAIILSAFLLLSTVLSSCKKIITVELPRNQLVTPAIFSDSVNANSALLGIYVNIMNQSTAFNIANGGITAYAGMSSDELYPTRGIEDENQFFTNAIKVIPENNDNYFLWRYSYEFIYQANACIDGLNKSQNLPISIKNRFIGEAKFMRAYLYFNLVNLFGDVPYITSTDFHINATIHRADKSTIYDGIIEDLVSAESLLPESDPTSKRIRPNKFAATAFLARVYLYLSKWNESEQAASRVINNPVFILEPSLDNVFLSNSKEAIWQMVPVQPGYNTPEGQLFNPTPAGTPRYGITNNLLNDFETSDLRKTHWAKAKTVNSILYTYPFKYKLRFDGSTSPTEYYVVLRLAEQYIIRAEARAKQNNLSGAKTDINIIRTRAGLTNITAASQADLLEAIDHEKRIEFFCEEGHRWFDLKRKNKADMVLAPLKAPNWQATDVLYPIPYREIQYNPSLVQNPGY